MKRLAIVLSYLLTSSLLVACATPTPTPVPPTSTPVLLTPTPYRTSTPAPTSTPALDPTAIAVSATLTAIAVPATTTTATCTSEVTYLVGNTDGEGVYIRRTPKMEDKIKAWPDGTPMLYECEVESAEGRSWRMVKDPDGNVGWVPEEFLLTSPTATPMTTPMPTPTP